MDWSGSFRPFVSLPESSLSLLYNYNYDQQAEIKQPKETQTTHEVLLPTIEKNNFGVQEKKKRLTSDQLECLESSFQEEIKLDPHRKLKLATELGLQPRQIAVWFQNRRARWKAKELERLYDKLKQEFDAVCKEKQKLQEEVVALRAIMKDEVTKKQISTDYTEISAEETVESTSIGDGSTNKPRGIGIHQAADCNYIFSCDEYNTVMASYWNGLPSYP